MTDYPYSAPCSHSLVYVYEILGLADHAGLLKVGDTSFKSPKKASELKVNCAELKTAAKKRIDRPEATFPQKSLGANSNFEVPLRRRNVIRAISTRKSSQKRLRRPA